MREGESNFFSRQGHPLRRASAVRGDEAKNGSIPPHKGVACEGARERQEEKKKQNKMR